MMNQKKFRPSNYVAFVAAAMSVMSVSTSVWAQQDQKNLIKCEPDGSVNAATSLLTNGLTEAGIPGLGNPFPFESGKFKNTEDAIKALLADQDTLNKFANELGMTPAELKASLNGRLQIRSFDHDVKVVIRNKHEGQQKGKAPAQPWYSEDVATLKAGTLLCGIEAPASPAQAQGKLNAVSLLASPKQNYASLGGKDAAASDGFIPVANCSQGFSSANDNNLLGAAVASATAIAFVLPHPAAISIHTGPGGGGGTTDPGNPFPGGGGMGGSASAPEPNTIQLVASIPILAVEAAKGLNTGAKYLYHVAANKIAEKRAADAAAAKKADALKKAQAERAQASASHKPAAVN